MKRSILFLHTITLLTTSGINAAKIAEGYATVVVSNPRLTDASSEMVEIEMTEINNLLPAPFHYIKDAEGNEIPSQLTHDGKMIFKADVASKGETTYRIFPSEKEHTYPIAVAGRVYPERADDLAWENETGGFRVYGPATQKKGEKAYGYDIFFKHPQASLILPTLYKEVTSKENRNKLDSLKKVDPKEAKRFSRSISYHVDHGLGMDCYAVGSTLGAGATALTQGDSIIYQWCYDKAEILDNGPIRFSCRLDFKPLSVGEMQSVTEHRIITLDSDTYLNRCRVWYDGLNGNCSVTTGIPLRDSTEYYSHKNGILAYSDPTQGKNNGRAMLGIVLTGEPENIGKQENHLLADNALETGKVFEYYWGFAWDREAPFDFKGWQNYLQKFSNEIKEPLNVRIGK